MIIRPRIQSALRVSTAKLRRALHRQRTRAIKNNIYAELRWRREQGR